MADMSSEIDEPAEHVDLVATLLGNDLPDEDDDDEYMPVSSQDDVPSSPLTKGGASDLISSRTRAHQSLTAVSIHALEALLDSAADERLDVGSSPAQHLTSPRRASSHRASPKRPAPASISVAKPLDIGRSLRALMRDDSEYGSDSDGDYVEQTQSPPRRAPSAPSSVRRVAFSGLTKRPSEPAVDSNNQQHKRARVARRLNIARQRRRRIAVGALYDPTAAAEIDDPKMDADYIPSESDSIGVSVSDEHSSDSNVDDDTAERDAYHKFLESCHAAAARASSGYQKTSTLSAPPISNVSGIPNADEEEDDEDYQPEPDSDLSDDELREEFRADRVAHIPRREIRELRQDLKTVPEPLLPVPVPAIAPAPVVSSASNRLLRSSGPPSGPPVTSIPIVFTGPNTTTDFDWMSTLQRSFDVLDATIGTTSGTSSVAPRQAPLSLPAVSMSAPSFLQSCTPAVAQQLRALLTGLPATSTAPPISAPVSNAFESALLPHVSISTTQPIRSLSNAPLFNSALRAQLASQIVGHAQLLIQTSCLATSFYDRAQALELRAQADTRNALSIFSQRAADETRRWQLALTERRAALLTQIGDLQRRSNEITAADAIRARSATSTTTNQTSADEIASEAAELATIEGRIKTLIADAHALAVEFANETKRRETAAAADLKKLEADSKALLQRHKEECSGLLLVRSTGTELLHELLSQFVAARERSQLSGRPVSAPAPARQSASSLALLASTALGTASSSTTAPVVQAPPVSVFECALLERLYRDRLLYSSSPFPCDWPSALKTFEDLMKPTWLPPSVLIRRYKGPVSARRRARWFLSESKLLQRALELFGHYKYIAVMNGRGTRQATQRTVFDIGDVDRIRTRFLPNKSIQEIQRRIKNLKHRASAVEVNRLNELLQRGREHSRASNGLSAAQQSDSSASDDSDASNSDHDKSKSSTKPRRKGIIWRLPDFPINNSLDGEVLEYFLVIRSFEENSDPTAPRSSRSNENATSTTSSTTTTSTSTTTASSSAAPHITAPATSTTTSTTVAAVEFGRTQYNVRPNRATKLTKADEQFLCHCVDELGTAWVKIHRLFFPSLNPKVLRKIHVRLMKQQQRVADSEVDAAYRARIQATLEADSIIEQQRPVSISYRSVMAAMQEPRASTSSNSQVVHSAITAAAASASTNAAHAPSVTEDHWDDDEMETPAAVEPVASVQRQNTLSPPPSQAVAPISQSAQPVASTRSGVRIRVNTGTGDEPLSQLNSSQLSTSALNDATFEVADKDLDRALAVCGRRCQFDVAKWNTLLQGLDVDADPLRRARLTSADCVERFRRIYQRLTAAAAAKRGK